MTDLRPGPPEVLPADRTIPDDVAESWRVAGHGGVELTVYRYRDQKPGRDNLLFAHANGFNAGCYVPYLDLLAERFNIFAYDHRGHGASDSPDPAVAENYALERFADDLAAVTAAVMAGIGDGGRLHFAAHSVGGIGFLIWAGREQAVPFASATLFEPPLWPRDPAQREKMAGGRADIFVRWAAGRRRRFDSLGDFREECGRIQAYRTIDPVMLDWLVATSVTRRTDGYELRCDGRNESRVYEMGRYAPTFDLAVHVAVPTRMYYADPALNEGVSPLEPSIRELAGEMARGEALVMPGQRHLMVLENPIKCADALWQYADGLG